MRRQHRAICNAGGPEVSNDHENRNLCDRFSPARSLLCRRADRRVRVVHRHDGNGEGQVRSEERRCDLGDGLQREVCQDVEGLREEAAEEAEGMAALILDWYPDLEVEVVYGGQPHYFYIMSAE